MKKSTLLGTIICGAALIALASAPSALAQGCSPTEGGIVCTFDAVGQTQTNKYDFGTHAIKITVNVVNTFDLEVGFFSITQGELEDRLISALVPAKCIPYEGATSNANLGTCGYYHVFDPPPSGDYTGNVAYTVLWDFPTIGELHDVRLYRAPLDDVDNSCPQGFDCYTQDITQAVIADLNSNGDPGVRGTANGFSDFEAVDRPYAASASFWLGLKNSDDVGTRFDLKAEVRNNGALVSSGALFGALGGSSGFNSATLRTMPLSLPTSAFATGTISMQLFVRNSCVGSSHNSGTARLWFNDAVANSRVNEPGPPTLFLVMPSTTLNLSPSVGGGPKKTRDVFVTGRDPLCNGPWGSFGTWTGVIP